MTFFLLFHITGKTSAGIERKRLEEKINLEYIGKCRISLTGVALPAGEFEVSSDSASPQSSHDEALNSPSSVSSPGSLYHDGSTQATLIQRSERLQLHSETSLLEDTRHPEFLNSFLDTTQMESPNKAHKAHRGADARSSMDANATSVESMFDAAGASSQANFNMFKKFATSEQGVFSFSAQALPGTSNTAKTVSTNATDTRYVGTSAHSHHSGCHA